MRKCSTPLGEFSETPTQSKGHSAPAPKSTTLAILRQFARAYSPAPRSGMPGLVLN